MKSKRIAACAALTLTACAPIMWSKEGATAQDYTTDSYQCERDARMSGYFGTGLYALVQFTEFQQRCMLARGWTASR